MSQQTNKILFFIIQMIAANQIADYQQSIMWMVLLFQCLVFYISTESLEVLVDRKLKFQLAKYVSTDEDLDAVEMHEPYTYLNGLTVDDLEDLLVDINIYR